MSRCDAVAVRLLPPPHAFRTAWRACAWARCVLGEPSCGVASVEHAVQLRQDHFVAPELGQTMTAGHMAEAVQTYMRGSDRQAELCLDHVMTVRQLEGALKHATVGKSPGVGSAVAYFSASAPVHAAKLLHPLMAKLAVAGQEHVSCRAPHRMSAVQRTWISTSPGTVQCHV